MIQLVSESCTMGLKVTRSLTAVLIFVLSTRGRYLSVQQTDLLDNLSPSIREGDVECFSEYMELWIHRMRIEGLRLWLSGMLRTQVSLSSLDHLNIKLSACGFSMRRDPDRNYIFRVMYSGCFVQLERDSYVIILNLLKRVSRFGGRTNSFVMKCPLVTAPPADELIQCDPEFIQVTRQVPLDSWNNKLHWSLSLRGKLVVEVEDATLIQLNVETKGSGITVKGKRREILSSEMVMEKYEEFLPLRLVSGHYSYSMEASCPKVSTSPAEKTVLHIFKRRMGLVKRGEYDGETLSLSNVFVKQTDTFSVSESSEFVRLTIPTSLILQTKNCTDSDGEMVLQPFYRVDAVLAFKETPHRVTWSMENFLTCAAKTDMWEDHVSKMSPETAEASPNPAAMRSDTLLPTEAFLLLEGSNSTSRFQATLGGEFHDVQGNTSPGIAPPRGTQETSKSVATAGAPAFTTPMLQTDSTSLRQPRLLPEFLQSSVIAHTSTASGSLTSEAEVTRTALPTKTPTPFIAKLLRGGPFLKATVRASEDAGGWSLRTAVEMHDLLFLENDSVRKEQERGANASIAVPSPSAPIAMTVPLPLNRTAAAELQGNVGEGDSDRNQTHGITSLSATALGQTFSTDFPDSSLVNMSHSSRYTYVSPPQWKAPAVKAWLAHVTDTTISLNSTNSVMKAPINGMNITSRPLEGA